MQSFEDRKLVRSSFKERTAARREGAVSSPNAGTTQVCVHTLM